MRARAGLIAGLAAAAMIGACASQGMPPGGPPDTTAPTLLRVSPESGALRTSPSAVEFRFSEVVNERPRGAPSLEKLVVISPSDGPPNVGWGRDRIVVRPRRGWRENTAYTVTILPGLSDLRGNATKEAFRTVFATGASIPDGVIRGVAFDWMAGAIARGARVEATIGADTLLRYSIAADSAGRFSLGSLPPSGFLVRAWLDVNANGIRDTREPWDTVTVVIRDSVRHDLYLIPHDSIGARISDISIADSVTIRIKFDKGLRAQAPLLVSQVQVSRVRDSVAIALETVTAAATFDSMTTRRKVAREDSIAHADTTERGRAALARADSAGRARQRDSSAAAQITAVRAARDTVKRDSLPKLGRPVPPTEFVIVTTEPIPEDVPLRIVVSDVQGLVGPPRTSERLLMRRKPAADTAAARRRPPP